MIVGTQRRRRSLGQDSIIGNDADVALWLSENPASASVTPVSGGNGCSPWQMFWGNLTGDYSGCIAANQAVVQAVANNAAAFYPQNVAQATQSMATIQEAGVPIDVYSAANSATGAVATWAYYALAGLAMFAVIEIAK
jgi:hypothetical protein